MFRTAASCSQHHTQTAIIGAGVIGLSVARALSKRGHEVLVLERSDAIGSGISGRNSEVIHAGIYYNERTAPLKSRLCVEGKRLLYEYCRDRNVPHRRCGKLLVATDAEQRDAALPALVERAQRNGVDDLRVLSKEDVAAYEPNVTCEGGVLSPSTGIVDSHALMTSLLVDAEEDGATLALRCRVEGGRPVPTDGGEKGSIVLDVDGSDIACDNVIVCAGLATDKVASAILSPSVSPDQTGSPNNDNVAFEEGGPRIPKQYYAKGNYFKLQNQKAPFSRLVYPLPDPRGGLGVHATIDLAGSIRFGPDVEWLDADVVPEDLDMDVDPGRAESFYAAVRKYWPDLRDGDLVPDYSGVRPKLLHPEVGRIDGVGDARLGDFLIAGSERHGVEGLTLLLGIESPGLTSSLAIGNYVAETIV